MATAAQMQSYIPLTYIVREIADSELQAVRTKVGALSAGSTVSFETKVGQEIAAAHVTIDSSELAVCAASDPHTVSYVPAPPTRIPTPSPTAHPTRTPTTTPTSSPTPYPTPSPTANPTPGPTFYPTAHPCDDGTHSCDQNGGGICYEASARSWACDCADGYYCAAGCDGPHSGHECVAMTAVPTAYPTLSPTAHPTRSPTANPSSNRCRSV